MLKACALAAVVLVVGATLVAAQGPEHRKQGGGHSGPAVGPQTYSAARQSATSSGGASASAALR